MSIPADTAPDQRASLLEQLRIDRPEAPPARSPLLWIGAGAAVVSAVGAAAWALLAPPADGAIGVAAATPSIPAAASAPAAPPSIASILDASGYVVARRQATVSAKITGKVVAVLIEEGQRVETGEIIARLDDTNARAQVAHAAAVLEQQRASLSAAAIALRNSEPSYARHSEQFRRAFISAQEFDAAKTAHDATMATVEVAARGVEVAEANLALAERALDDTVVRAPFPGIVTVKAAQEGEMVSPISAGGGFTRTGIGTIVDMDSIEVEVDVSENFINRVQRGARVAITLNAYPEDRAGGRVIAIIPTADRAKATVKVRVGFDAIDARVLPEMGVRVAFLAAETESITSP
jgi:HlyD family secretion protein